MSRIVHGEGQYMSKWNQAYIPGLKLINSSRKSLRRIVLLGVILGAAWQKGMPGGQSQPKLKTALGAKREDKTRIE